jgi:hypothetical protein
MGQLGELHWYKFDQDCLKRVLLIILSLKPTPPNLSRARFFSLKQKHIHLLCSSLLNHVANRGNKFYLVRKRMLTDEEAL